MASQTFSYILGLGTNMGHRSRNLSECLKHFKSIGTIKNTSFLYESAPMYFTKQQSFLNAAVHLESHYDPITVLERVKQIEHHEMKRRTNFPNGPRIIDIDLLCAFHNSKEIHLSNTNTPNPLTIPHPRLSERNFAITPLSDLLPDYKPHGTIHTVTQLSHSLPLDDDSQNLFQVLPLQNGERPESKSSVYPLDNSTHSLQHRTLLMAILNITPDSFSDGGTWMHHTDRILKYIDDHLINGTQIDILDVGGQSTRPQSDRLSVDEELDRVIPVLDAIREHFGDSFYFNQSNDNNIGIETVDVPSSIQNTIPISIDTYHSEVARECVMNHGVSIVNDISGGTMDDKMYHVVAELGVPYICMHLRGDPSTMQNAHNLQYGVSDKDNHQYNAANNEMEQFIQILTEELHDRVRSAESGGIAKWNMIIDPGIGFAKTSEQNQYLLNNLWRVRNGEKYPILSGCSRKSFLNGILGEEIKQKGADSVEKVIGTQVGLTASILSGADMVRVHDLYSMDIARRVSDSLKNVNENRFVERRRKSLQMEPEEDGGNQSIPVSWEDMLPFADDHVLSAKGLDLSFRTDEVWKQYKLQRKEQSTKYVDYSHFIRVKFLGFDEEEEITNDGQKKLRAVPKHEGYQCVRFELNEFPRHLDSNIEQYCLWSTHKMERSEIEQRIESEFEDQEYIWWENEKTKKTVPDVWHIHVLVLKDSRKELLL